MAFGNTVMSSNTRNATLTQHYQISVIVVLVASCSCDYGMGVSGPRPDVSFGGQNDRYDISMINREYLSNKARYDSQSLEDEGYKPKKNDYEREDPDYRRYNILQNRRYSHSLISEEDGNDIMVQKNKYRRNIRELLDDLQLMTSRRSGVEDIDASMQYAMPINMKIKGYLIPKLHSPQ